MLLVVIKSEPAAAKEEEDGQKHMVRIEGEESIAGENGQLHASMTTRKL